jgi:streptogrisin D
MAFFARHRACPSKKKTAALAAAAAVAAALTVGVSTAGAQGAREQSVVGDTLASLHGAVAQLDALPSVPDTAWGIDPRSDSVVLTIADAAPQKGAARLIDAARVAAAASGGALRIEHVGGSLRTQIYDGDQIEDSRAICSAGFNVTISGRSYVLTAGHCTQDLPYWDGLGPTTASVFPKHDYGLVRNASGRAPGAVDLYNGRSQPITSLGTPKAGEPVCKSGRSTEVTCGTVLALDETVDYADGNVVHGLIKTDAHAAAGDSGAALYHGSQGLGTLSGGNGQIEYFQPLAPALRAFGAELAPSPQALGPGTAPQALGSGTAPQALGSGQLLGLGG